MPVALIDQLKRTGLHSGGVTAQESITKSLGKMIASRLLRLLAFFTFAILVKSTTVQEAVTENKNEVETKKIEVYDGIYVKIPKSNNTDKLISFEVDTYKKLGEEGRGKKKNMMEKFLPLFIMPFVMQSAMVPFFLSTLKFMLFKSLMVGKLALALIIFNAFRNHNSFNGRDSEMANIHYGYHGNGMEEYGAYVN